MSRPLNFDDFTGQGALIQNLKVFIDSAKTRQAALDHVLLYGPPGLGKTTLAQIIASELRVSFKITSAPIISKPGDLAALLTNLQPYEVLFIDEIHRLSKHIEEILYPAMEDRQLDLMLGEGAGAKSVRIDLAPFTLIGATTRAGLLSRPLRERFGIILPLKPYTLHEIQDIILRNAGLLNIALIPEAAREIAKCCRGTPRIAGRLLRRVADFAVVNGKDSVSVADSKYVLQQLEIDNWGLDEQDRKYLKFLQTHRGPVGLETLAAALLEDRQTLEEAVEPYLIQQGLIQRTPRGRALTEVGHHYLSGQLCL